ncbi:calpain-A-like isoform X2 [Oppia nitens]|uniref:calpain-A-like isoform X2 n=1 Tax=Oppia nitens TaxID=1686743 RepID=UPI0023DB4F51|nr:calpain-A-like isoform X2 [Oppia nitens]
MLVSSCSNECVSGKLRQKQDNNNVLKVGVMKEDDIILKVNADNRQVHNTCVITQPLWRHSVQSIDFRPINNFRKLGERKSGIKIPGQVQDYYEIRDKCLRDGILFEDDAFPANDSSFYMSSGRGRRSFQWIRPTELSNDPKFISDGALRFDVMQGELGNCWLLAAIANLTLNEKLFHRVVPHDQTFDKPEYAGIFHFRFWQYGNWVDVVVDDRLPTINGKLMLMHSKDKHEFWSALVEKAYAKLHGSYEALKGGTTCEAMEDFTGGLTEHFDLQSNDCPPNLLNVMLKACERISFQGCSIEALDASQMEAEMSNGLIRGHAYSVTGVKLVQLSTHKVQGKIPLVRVRNPWGNEAEWKGPWSDKSREWTVVPEYEKKQLGLTFDADGEFWMAFKDFKENFTRLEITSVSPDSLQDDEKRRWEVSYFEGSWIRGISAGGCRNHLQTFHLNPQYLITLEDPDENDDEDACTCVVALMQKNHRLKRKMGLDSLTIGFAIYEVKDGHFVTDGPKYESKFKPQREQVLTTEYFKYNASVAKSPTFINLREVNGRFKLKPGKYCIIPSTFDPGEEGEFLIRFFTEKPPKDIHESDEDIGLVDDKNAGKTNGVTDNLVGDNEPKEPEPTANVANTDNNVDVIQTVLTIINLFSNCWRVIQNAEVTEEVTERRAKQSESQITSFFAKLAGEDMEVDAIELQEIMNHALKKEFKFDGFSLESCRSMIAMLDEDRTGKLGMNEFSQLWRNIRQWCTIFKKHDTDSSNTISATELRSAYREVGLNVNRRILEILIFRYGIISSGNKKEKNTEKSLTFDDFIHSSMKLKHAIDIWTAKNKQPTSGGQSPSGGRVLPFGNTGYNTSNIGNKNIALNTNSSFTLEEFVERILYC